MLHILFFTPVQTGPDPRRMQQFDRISGRFDDQLSRLPDGGSGPTKAADPLTGYVIDAPNGLADIEKASALLRVIEAHRGWPDYHIPLIAVLYPDLAALADRPFELHPSPRLVALALDETALMNTIPAHAPHSANYTSHMSAPLILARARLVANARRLGLPALFVPRHDPNSDAASVEERAMQDGFDGILTDAI